MYRNTDDHLEYKVVSFIKEFFDVNGTPELSDLRFSFSIVISVYDAIKKYE